MPNIGNLPAYPQTPTIQDGESFYPTQYKCGLSKREIIAAMCLQGLLACPNITASSNFKEGFAPSMAEYATTLADSLLTHLQNTEK